LIVQQLDREEEKR